MVGVWLPNSTHTPAHILPIHEPRLGLDHDSDRVGVFIEFGGDIRADHV
jgi:hypothetical protein